MTPTFRAAVAAMAMALLLASCGGSGGQGGVEGSGAGTVTVALPSDDAGAIELHQAQAKAFMKQHPDIKVELLTVPAQGYDQKVLTMIAGGTPPDIFGTGEVAIPTIVRKHAALDLKPLIEQENYDLSDFYPEVIKGLTFDGQIAGLTDNWDTQVLYYNRTLFDAAGVPYPTAEWTWEDFRAAARRLTSGKGADKVFGTIYDPWFVSVFNQVWSHGGEVFDAAGTECALTGPRAVEGIQRIADLLDSGVAPTPGQLGQGAEAAELFETGRGAMLVGAGRWAAHDLREVTKFDWAVAPLPKGPGGRANFFHLPMYAIASNAENKAGAWKFLKYLVSYEVMMQASNTAEGVPSRRSVATDPAVANNELATRHDAYEPFITSLPTVRRAPYVANFPMIEDTLQATLDPVFAGKQRAAAVVEPLCDQIDQALEEAT